MFFVFFIIKKKNKCIFHVFKNKKQFLKTVTKQDLMLHITITYFLQNKLRKLICIFEQLNKIDKNPFSKLF